MNGRNHLIVALAIAGANATVAWELGLLGPGGALVLLAGVLVGSLLPDVDAQDSKIFHGSGMRRARRLDTILSFIGRVTQAFVYLPFALVSGREHRGIMHSLVGAAAASAFWGVIGWAAAAQFHLGPVAFVFAWGILAGCVLHLVCDSFTRSGVPWLLPFSGRRVAGQATTGRISEDLVALGFLAVAAGVYWFGRAPPSWFSLPVGWLAPLLSLAFVILYFFVSVAALRVLRVIPGFS